MILQTINHMNVIDSLSYTQSNSSKESNKNFDLNELKDDEEVNKKELNTIPYSKALRVDNRNFL